ncbi:hypothetical protein ACJ41O_005901 [Fusarium nematophilum]
MSRKAKPEQDGLLPSDFVKEKLGIMTTLADCLSILCPLAFLVFSIVLLRTHGRRIDEAYAQYRNTITTLATAFPILIDPIRNDEDFQESHGIRYSQFNHPSMFADEAGIEARQATLQLRVALSAGERPVDSVRARCGVTQHYVESLANCSLASPSALQNCTVVKQRSSRKSHAPGNISLLSFPEVFAKISGLLPQNPSVLGLGSGDEPVELDKVSKDLSGYRLSQLINSYLLIGQAFPRVLGGGLDPDAVFEPNFTVPVEVETLVEVYHVPVPWTSACVFSCVVFLTAGVLSVVFIRLANGPDVLGLFRRWSATPSI